MGTTAVSPSSINFGSVAVGGKANQSVTVLNQGAADLVVSQVDVKVPGFTVSGISLPLTIRPGKQTIFDVLFSPKTTGSVSGVVSVFTNSSSEIVSVSGKGVSATSVLNANSNTLNFGNVAVGGSGSLSVNLTNAGNSSVTISGISSSSSLFTTSDVSAGLILKPDQTFTLNVTFSPLTAGSQTANLTVVSNASNSPARIALSGSGVQAGSHSVTLSWTPSTSTVAGYNIYRSAISGGAYIKLNTSLVPGNQYTDATVQSGQTYYYAATAVNSAGLEGSSSPPVEVIIPSP